MRGSVALLAGEPGVGKSTLALQMLCGVVQGAGVGLLISAEESPTQVAMRAARLGPGSEGILIAPESSLGGALAVLEEAKPELAVVDSIQTIYDTDLAGGPGSPVQVRECVARLVRAAKDMGSTLLLIGHVTKDGTVAGPKSVEHLVDVVLTFEGEAGGSVRVLRSAKNRFGPCPEVAFFEMTEGGLVCLSDVSRLFLARRPDGAGVAVAGVLEGSRALLVEVQALVAPSPLSYPRRAAAGLDGRRVPLVLAVVEAKLGVPVSRADVFAAIPGGMTVHDPGADLALAMAVVSCWSGRPVASDTVVIGEVGLGGEVRAPRALPQRLTEAARMGFSRVVVPKGVALPGLEVVGVADVAEAAEACLGPGWRKRGKVAGASGLKNGLRPRVDVQHAPDASACPEEVD